MEKLGPTTSFGRRPATLGQIAAQMQLRESLEAAARPGANTPAAVNKWRLFRTLAEIRERLGVSDRALSVLNALLSFHPETALTLPASPQAGAEAEAADPACDLIVFPSNKALSLRAHGMAAATLWRHLTALVEAGLIQRRDSPNGKRYARKAAEGAAERFSHAYGFDLTPLVARAAEFEAAAEEARRAARARQLLREQISLLRRDAGKLIALGLDEGLPGDWDESRRRYLTLMTPLRRIRGDAALQQLADDLAALRAHVAKSLESCLEHNNSNGNASQSEGRQSNSKTPTPYDLEPASNDAGGKATATTPHDAVSAKAPGPERAGVELPLGLVMEACPDVNVWASDGRVRSWEAFRAAVGLIRPMLGVSPDAWRDARQTLGDLDAHIAVATILQRSEHSSEAEAVRLPSGASAVLVNGSPAIRSAGGYLRALTEEARAGRLALGPLLMALIGQRLKARPGRARAGER